MKQWNYDVAVCGAGVAGIAAAIAAARSGAKTLLIEKQCLLGGLATSGLIYVFLPLCDGYGTQMISGITEEMIRRCTEYGPFDVPAGWGGPADAYPGVKGDRFQCCFSPAGFTLTLDKMLAEAGVELWLDSVVVQSSVEANHVLALDVFNASGMQKVSAKHYVDASGSGMLAECAGCALRRSVNYLTPWFIEMSEKPDFFHFTEALHIQCGGALSEEFAISECHSSETVTRMVRDAWALVRARYDALPEGAIKQNYPVHLPAMPQLRKIGAIEGLYHLGDADCGVHFEDSIGVGTDWRKPSKPWEVPYRALVTPEVDNLIAAGRCIAAADEAWEVLRVIPNAVMLGEAAGSAAAQAAAGGADVRKLDVAALQAQLRRNHGIVYASEGRRSPTGA